MYYEKQLKYVVFLLSSIVMLYFMITSCALYADAFYMFYGILEKGRFFVSDHYRFAGDMIKIIPLYIALKLGISNTNILVAVFSTSYFAIPSFLWLSILYSNRNSHLFWPLTIIFAFAYYNMIFMSISELNYLFPLVVLAITLLLQDNLTRLKIVTLLVISLLTTSLYSSMLFFAPVLFLMVIYRIKISNKMDINIILLAMVAFFFACGFAVSAVSILMPRDAGNLKGALNISVLLQNKQLTISLLVSILYMFLLQFKISKFVTYFYYMLLPLTLCLFIPYFWAEAEQHYLSRVIVSLSVFILCCLLLLMEYRRKIFVYTIPKSQIMPVIYYILPTLMAVALILSLAYNITSYHRYMVYFENLITEKSGLIDINTTQIAQDGGKFAFQWTFPIASIVLSDDKDSAIVYSSYYNGWQPFDYRKERPNAMEKFTKSRRLFKQLWWTEDRLNKSFSKALPSSFDAIHNNILNQSATGIYGHEGSFCWGSKHINVKLNNKGGDTLKIQFTGSNLYRLVTNKYNTIPYLDIIVNNISMGQFKLTDQDQTTLELDITKLPHSSVYSIEIVASHTFIPSEEVQSSLDNRELSIQIHYIGK